jgi:hypothetical protein
MLRLPEREADTMIIQRTKKAVVDRFSSQRKVMTTGKFRRKTSRVFPYPLHRKLARNSFSLLISLRHLHSFSFHLILVAADH